MKTKKTMKYFESSKNNNQQNCAAAPCSSGNNPSCMFLCGRYKQQRIDLIKNSLPTYGRFYRVKRDEFISETEKEHELIHVVVHLYQNTIPACIRLNLILEDIAPQFTHVKFIRTRSTDLVESFSNVALPMLLVYRGGEVVHTIPQVSKHFPRKWEDKDVVAYLAKKGILNKQAYKPPRQSKKDIRLKEDY